MADSGRLKAFYWVNLAGLGAFNPHRIVRQYAGKVSCRCSSPGHSEALSIAGQWANTRHGHSWSCDRCFISKGNVCGGRPGATGATIGDILKDRRMGVAPHSDNQRSVLRPGTDVGPAIVREAPDLEGTRRTGWSGFSKPMVLKRNRAEHFRNRPSGSHIASARPLGSKRHRVPRNGAMGWLEACRLVLYYHIPLSS